MALKVTLALALAAMLSGAPGAAAAQDPPPDRELPDYDGRGEEPTTAGEVALWVPRVLLSPLYLVSEFVLRRPLGYLVSAAEESDLPALLVDFFTFGPEQKAGIIPTALFDFGFRPSVGIYGFGDDFIVDDNDLRFYAAYGGESWYALSVTNRINTASDVSSLSLNGSLENRPDFIFHGLGYDSHDRNQSRYGALRRGVSLEFESALWRASSVLLRSRFTDVEFSGEGCCSEPGIDARVDQGAFEAPPGREGYTVYSNRVEFAFDTREERPAPGTGVRLELEGEHAFDTRDLERRWVQYGGTLGLYWDPPGHNRTLSLSLTALFADPLGDAPVPFTELITLGGTRLMRGFLEGRLVGRSAAVATFEYRWPLWIWLDGSFHFAVGNVFDEHLSGFATRRLRMSTGIGLRAVQARDHSFDVLIGVGSEPFEDLESTKLRFTIGARRGF